MIKLTLLILGLLMLTPSINAGLPPTTLSGQADATKATTFNFKTPYNQSTVTSGGGLIETGNKNQLSNPSFENTNYSTGWANSLGSISLETTNVVHGVKALAITSGGAGIRIYQSVTPTNIASMSGQQGVARVWINSTDPLLQVCVLAAGTNSGFDTNCVTVPVTTPSRPFYPVEIPFTINATSNGIVIKSATTTAQSIYIDDAFMGVGLLYGNLQLDNVYSAQVSSAGIVSGENKDFITGNCAVSGTSVFTCTLNAFTVSPNCTAMITDSNARVVWSTTQSSSQVVINTAFSTNGTLAAHAFSLSCQKSGTDYLTSSSSVYSQASANYSYTNGGVITIGATTAPPTKGTIVTDRVMYSRYGQNLKALYQYEHGAAGAAGSGDYLYTLPNSLSFDSSVVFYNTGATSATLQKSKIGTGTVYNGATQSYTITLYAYDATRFRAFISYSGSAPAIMSSSFFQLSGANFGFEFNIEAPIAGWSNASQIVGSFSGYTNVPGYSGNVDTFSVSFGTTNATTVCSASPCSYLDQIGTAVSSVTRSALGFFSVNTVKTYSKLKWTIVGQQAGGSYQFIRSSGGCSNCNTATFEAANNAVSANVDIYGTVIFQGSY